MRLSLIFCFQNDANGALFQQLEIVEQWQKIRLFQAQIQPTKKPLIRSFVVLGQEKRTKLELRHKKNRLQFYKFSFFTIFPIVKSGTFTTCQRENPWKSALLQLKQRYSEKNLQVFLKENSPKGQGQIFEKPDPKYETLISVK